MASKQRWVVYRQTEFPCLINSHKHSCRNKQNTYLNWWSMMVIPFGSSICLITHHTNVLKTCRHVLRMSFASLSAEGSCQMSNQMPLPPGHETQVFDRTPSHKTGNFGKTYVQFHIGTVDIWYFQKNVSRVPNCETYPLLRGSSKKQICRLYVWQSQVLKRPPCRVVEKLWDNRQPDRTTSIWIQLVIHSRYWM